MSALARTQKPHTKACYVLPDRAVGGVSYSSKHLLSNIHTLETISIGYFRLTNSLFLPKQRDSSTTILTAPSKNRGSLAEVQQDP